MTQPILSSLKSHSTVRVMCHSYGEPTSAVGNNILDVVYVDLEC